MITVDCRDIEPIKHELLVYVSDQVAAIPALKAHEFVLSPIEDEAIDVQTVIDSIREYLESIGESRNFAVISEGGVLVVKSINGRQLERDPPPPYGMFSCPHCGFVTRYEAEHNAHKKMHYL